MASLDDFQENKEGNLTITQRRFLLRWMLIHVGLNGILLGGLSIAILVAYPQVGYVLLVASIVYIGMIGYQYWSDLYVTKPERIGGLIKKVKKRVRGPTHYYLLVDNIQLRVSKSIWEQLGNEVELEVYFAPHTRWVLAAISTTRRGDR
jgi:hypothetical protein